MRRRVLVVVGLVIGAIASAVAPAIGKPPAGDAVVPGLRAGVGAADLTWHVGASAGQYATDGVGVGSDPSVQAIKQAPSFGVQSRLSARAPSCWRTLRANASPW